MNQKAHQLGLANTHYMNPHGLHDAQHYTTARDMANLTRWALSVPGFLEVFSRKESWPMEATNMQPARTFWCADLMRVGGATYYRDYVVGSKTGYHDQAGHTLVTVARRDGVTAFVEVKYRRDARFGTPAEAVTPQKMRRVIDAATCYAAEHGLLETPLRFDVVELSAGNIRHIEGAFDESGCV